MRDECFVSSSAALPARTRVALKVKLLGAKVASLIHVLSLDHRNVTIWLYNYSLTLEICVTTTLVYQLRIVDVIFVSLSIIFATHICGCFMAMISF